jgi:hypothetical protein
VGSVFRYIADDSLEAHRMDADLACNVCGATGGILHFRADALGGVYEVCQRCIKALPFEQLGRMARWQSERHALDHLRAVFPELPEAELLARRDAICAELRRTPRIPPFCQDDEWPLCCGEFAEYVGRPGLPEGWDDFGGLSVFRCQRCGQEFEVFQHT